MPKDVDVTTAGVEIIRPEFDSPSTTRNSKSLHRFIIDYNKFLKEVTAELDSILEDMLTQEEFVTLKSKYKKKVPSKRNVMYRIRVIKERIK